MNFGSVRSALGVALVHPNRCFFTAFCVSLFMVFVNVHRSKYRALALWQMWKALSYSGYPGHRSVCWLQSVCGSVKYWTLRYSLCWEYCLLSAYCYSVCRVNVYLNTQLITAICMDENKLLLYSDGKIWLKHADIHV